VVVTSTVLNLRLMETLGLSLAAMALVSTAIFAFAAEKRIGVVVDDDRVRVFKDEESSLVVGFELGGGEWTGFRLDSCGFDNAQVTRTEPLPGNRFRLGFEGRFAGRSQGLRLRLSVTDPLGLFQVADDAVCDELVLDVLPRSLLGLAVPMAVPTFGLGDQPAGYPGPGQELYGLEYYNPSGDAKDIIWKRAARSPDETLVRRVRESSMKESVRVGILRAAEREDGGREWNDMLCEGLASVGRDLLQMGARLTVLYRSGGTLVEGRTADLNELADVVMSCSAAPSSLEISDLVARSDLVITGLRELEDERIADAVSGKPLLLIPEGAVPAALTKGWTVYSGEESLVPLLRRVMER
jgi:uncharacterized protein (DUF58 family)